LDHGYSEENEQEDLDMTVERYLRLIAGSFVLASLLLGYYHSPYWFWFTGFVAVNLIQFAFTSWCPMMTFLRWLGVRSEGSGPITGHA
jgi:hypothetical protein